MPRPVRLPAPPVRRSAGPDLSHAQQPPTHGGNGFAPPTVAPGHTAGEDWRWDDRAGWQEQEVDAGAAFAETTLSPELAQWLESVRTGEIEPAAPGAERPSTGEALAVDTASPAAATPTPFGAESVPPVIVTGQPTAEQPSMVGVASPEAPEPVAEESEEPPAAEPETTEDVAEEAKAVDEDVAETVADLAPTEQDEPPSTADATAAELSAWRAEMRASTSTMKTPGLGDAAGGAGVLRGVGAARRAGRQGATGDQTRDAQAAVSNPPDPGKPLQPPEEEHPVPEAPRRVEEKSNLRLPDQRLPELVTSPRGSVPKLGERPMPPPEPAPPVLEMQRVGTGADPAPSTDPNEEHAAEVEETAEQPATPEPAAEPADPLALKDEPPQPQPPLPEGAKIAVSVVVANLLADPAGKAERILNDARRPAYNGVLLLKYPDIGNDELPGLTEAVSTELRMVAHAAGVSDEELNAQVTKRQAELEKQRAAAEAAICEASTEETQSRQETGQAEVDAAAAARTSVDVSTERKTEAAAGPNDPTVVRARRDRLKEAISRTVGQQRQLYDAAVARRHTQLQMGERTQLLAYQAVVQREEAAATAVESGQSVTFAQGMAAANVRLWGKERERELHREILRLTREAKAFGDGYKSEIWTAGDVAREMIQSWANGLLNEQENWWQRLLRMFQDWMVQAKAESEAWQQVRASETKDALLMDLVFLNQETQRLGENVDRATIEGRKDISEEQKAVLLAYYADGPGARNPVGAVAAGVLVRMSINRRPELMRRFERIVVEKPYTDWEKQDALGNTQNSTFNAARLSDDLYRAMKGGVTGWGTDEAAIFTALDRLTPIQAAAIRNAYRADHDRDLDYDLRDELSGAEEDRAVAQLEGNQAMAVAAELYEAMKGGITGIGTDEAVIMAALRNKTQEERDAIEAEYLRMYGTPLREHLKDEMSGHDLDRAEALADGDTSKADAIALDQAMRGGFFGGFFGGDKTAAEAVFTDIRQDVVAYANSKDPPWTSAQVEAEVLRRNQEVEGSHNIRYAGDWGPGEESTLRAGFKAAFSGPTLDLVTGLADNDLAKADAARIAIERDKVFGPNQDVVNGVLESQYTRALEDVRRDGTLRMRALEERAQKEGWDAYRLEAAKRDLEGQFESVAKERAMGNMKKLEDRFDSSYKTWWGGGLRTTIELNMSGHDRDKARDLLAKGGYLTPDQQVHYAIAGAGTREEPLKDVFKGKTAAQIAKIRADYAKRYPGRNLDDDIDSELSGRDAFDTKMLLKGVPENAEQEITQMRERAQYELNNSAASGSSVERGILEKRLAKLEEQYKVIQSAPEGPERTAAIAQFKQRSGAVSSAVESYRQQVDAVTDVVATVAAITAAVVVAVVLTVLTAGAATGPYIAALAATLGTSTAGLTAGVAAAAALAATVITKQAMLGGAHGWEDVAVDLAVGAVDIVAAVGTAGMGNALIRAGRAGRLATMAASKSRGARILAHGLAEGAEGLVGAFPAAITGNVLNDKNWEQGNPFANIALGTLIETGMGTAMSAGMGGFGGIKAPSGAPTVRPPSADLLAHRGTPDGRMAQWRAYKLENPNANMQEFLRQFDAGAAQRLVGEEANQQLQRKLRGDLLSGLPANQRGVLGGVPIQVLSEADFARLARGATGPTALVNIDGVARLLVKEGTDPRALAAQADSLARSVVRDARGRPVRVDDVLPRDLRGRVPVAVDPNLPGNTVRVHYDIDPKTGLVINIRMLTGPAATSVDIQLHARTARLMERYAGFMGRARQILDRIGVWVGLNGSPPPGSRAWEARLEVEKLPRIIRDRLEQLSKADLTPAMRRELLEDIASLQRQLDEHGAVLRDMELEPGRGFVAADADPKVTTPTIEAPKTPTKVRDAEVPDRFEKTVIQDAIKKIDKIDPPLLTPDQFTSILKNVPGGVKGAEEFASRLNLMLASMEKLTARATADAEKTTIVSAVRKILQGLADTEAKVRDTAEFLRAQAVKSPTLTDKALARMLPDDIEAAKASDSLAAASKILDVMSLEDIRAIRADHPNMGATSREHDNAVFDALAAITKNVKETDAARLRQLIGEAGVTTAGGSPKPDIFRLWSILEVMGEGPHTADAVSAAIVAQNDLVARMKNLKGGLAAELEKRLGLARTAQGDLPDNLLQLRKLREAQVGKAITGEDVQDFFRADWVIEALESTVDAGGKIDMANWRTLEDWLRRAALDAKKLTGEPDLQIINQMRNIVGYYWEVLRFKSLDVASGQTKKVYPQAEIKIDGTPYEPRIDNMVVDFDNIDPKTKTVTIWLEEDKTGDATLSRAQQELFDRFQDRHKVPLPKITVKFAPEILSKAGVKKSEELTVIIKGVVVWYPKDEINRQAGAAATLTAGQP